ncbi:MAG: hypothetical protein JXR70_14890 [Spirochaetales bacterium]|nr:hypothetical protein [Spirochaetales bacterium]
MVLFDLSLSGSEKIKEDNQSDWHYLCYRCKSHIASYRDIFNIPGKGSTHYLRNTFGLNFHVITFINCQNLLNVSSPFEEYSWFLPYSWIVTNCRYCQDHLGWRFVHEKSQPAEFFGLIQDKLIIDYRE